MLGGEAGAENARGETVTPPTKERQHRLCQGTENRMNRSTVQKNSSSVHVCGRRWLTFWGVFYWDLGLSY